MMQVLKRWGLGAISLLLTVSLSFACSSTADESSVTSNTTDTRPVEHAMGVTDVPAVPSQVVVLDTAPLDAAIAMDVIPIGAWIDETFPAYLGDRTDGMVTLGSAGQPNLEKIAQLQPDLILGSKVGGEAVYSQLSQIAPTILTEGNGREGNWPEQLKVYGDALGKRDRVNQLLAKYQQQLETVRQQIGTPEDTVVSVVFSYQNHFGFYSHTSFAGSILKDVGFARPTIQTQPISATYLSVVSKEAFQDLDGDVIFLLVNDGEDTLTYEEFAQDPLFSQLSAVKNGQVYPVLTEVWTAGRNILAAQQVLQNITDALAN
ncbi:MAG: iron-siderophore ABC transporter substrate-binding protein [Leptolyngbya sp. SIOISBB]|nr:iron-siderophore ABC transporter substrate-binding protein [Leptolyngbya sp. SIOISBB]